MDLYNNESAEKSLRQSSTYMHWAFVDVLTNLSDVFSADFLSELLSIRLLPKRPQDKEGRTLIHVSQVYVRGKMHTVKTACSPQKRDAKRKRQQQSSPCLVHANHTGPQSAARKIFGNHIEFITTLWTTISRKLCYLKTWDYHLSE